MCYNDIKSRGEVIKINTMKTKNIAIILIIGVLIAVVGIGAGCGREEVKEEAAPSEKEEEKKVEEKEELLADVLAKTKNIAPVKYDVVITGPGQPEMKQKAWLKEKKMRIEMTVEGQKVIYLMDFAEKLAYLYIPAQNMAMKMDFGEIQESVGESPVEQFESLMDFNPVVIGNEVIDGKDCLVIEYSTEGIGTKMWIWKKYGLAVRTETTTVKGKFITELENIEFDSISDSMFELPAGVEIMEMPSF